MTESNALHRLVRQVPTRIAGAGVLTLALAAGFAGGRVTAAAPEQAAAVAPAPAARTLPLASPGAPGSYSAIVDRVSPAVVTVTVQMKATAQQTSIPELPDFFRQFGEPFGQQFRVEPRPRPSGLGSGVIIREDGYILTNNHVVDGADRIRVELNDGRSFVATVVGTDPASDLAVIKVQATGLPTLPYGDSDQVKVGDVVLAVGNPLGIGQTVTMGIVSAKGRTTPGSVGDGSYADFLQTDAPINRGNSGGALVDLQGNLVGINAQILSPSGGNIGLGFAIPSTMVKAVAQQLIDGGVVRRSKLGVNVQSLTPELAESLGLPDVHGALVSGVEAGSPAERAGLKEQDVIVSSDGHAVVDSNGLRNRVASTKPGTTAEVKVLRDGKPQTLSARVVEREPARLDARGRGGEEGDGESGFGMTLSPVTPQIARQFELPPSSSGVVVTDVAPDSVAANAGIRRGDVIKRVNGKEVASIDSVRSALTAQSDGKPALVMVSRQGANLFVALPQARS
jgi:Do/DeqQ family serine protease